MVISSREEKDDFSEIDRKGRVFRFKRNSLPYPFNRMAENAKLLFLLLALMNRFDTLFIFGRNSLNARTARFFGKTVVYRPALANVDDYGTLMDGVRAGWYYRMTERMVSYHWAISNEIREKLLVHGIDPNRTIYCPNSLSPKNIIKKMPPPGSDKDGFPVKIAFVGEVCRRKGFDRVIRLMDSLEQNDFNPELYICGPVGDRRLYEKARELNKVYYFGIVDDVFDVLTKCTFFLFPTRREGFPTALIEAMSCGLLCIASELPVIRNDIISHGINGFCYSFNRTDEILDVIGRLVIDLHFRDKIRNRAISTIKEKFDSEKNYEHLTHNVFDEINRD